MFNELQNLARQKEGCSQETSVTPKSTCPFLSSAEMSACSELAHSCPLDRLGLHLPSKP